MTIDTLKLACFAALAFTNDLYSYHRHLRRRGAFVWSKLRDKRSIARQATKVRKVPLLAIVSIDYAR